MPEFVQRQTSRRALLRGLTAGAAAMAAGGLAACSARPAQTAGGAVTGGFTITDQRGKQIVFDRPAQRIATTVIPSPAILTAVDGSYDRIKGINSSTLTANQQGLFGVMHPASRETPTVAGSDFVPNVEAILNLRPDVVIQWGDLGEDVIAPLERAGLKVLGLTYGTQQDLETWVTMFGTLIGKPQRAAEIIGWMHQEITSVQGLVANKPKSSVLYLRSTGDGFTSANGRDYLTFTTELAGAVNPAKDLPAAQPQISTEQLHAWNPDVLLLSAFDTATPEQIFARPELSTLRAVKDRRVYKVPLGGYRWDPPNCESPLMWHWLAEVLHAELPRGLRRRVAERFSYLYGYQVNDQQIDGILRLDMNSTSAGYDRFRA